MVRDLRNFAKEMMDWNSCLTIGLGEGVGVALRRSGVLGGRVRGSVECVLGGLRFLSQVMVSIWVEIQK